MILVGFDDIRGYHADLSFFTDSIIFGTTSNASPTIP
jgi:hypothetical protein